MYRLDGAETEGHCEEGDAKGGSGHAAIGALQKIWTAN